MATSRHHTTPQPYVGDDDVDTMRTYLADFEETMPIEEAAEYLAKEVALRELRRLLDPNAWHPTDFRRGTAALIRQRIAQIETLAEQHEP